VGFPDEDADVESEREYIQSTSIHKLFETDAIVVHGLTKSFSGFRAVDSLTFRVPRVSARTFRRLIVLTQPKYRPQPNTSFRCYLNCQAELYSQNPIR